MLKPEIFKQNPCIFKNKILSLQKIKFNSNNLLITSYGFQTIKKEYNNGKQFCLPARAILLRYVIRVDVEDSRMLIINNLCKNL